MGTLRSQYAVPAGVHEHTETCLMMLCMRQLSLSGALRGQIGSARQLVVFWERNLASLGAYLEEGPPPVRRLLLMLVWTVDLEQERQPSRVVHCWP